jgi:hypothetical protein
VLVLGSSGVELTPGFCNPWLSGGLHVAGDLNAPCSEAAALARLVDLDQSSSASLCVIA